MRRKCLSGKWSLPWVLDDILGSGFLASTEAGGILGREGPATHSRIKITHASSPSLCCIPYVSSPLLLLVLGDDEDAGSGRRATVAEAASRRPKLELIGTKILVLSCCRTGIRPITFSAWEFSAQSEGFPREVGSGSSRPGNMSRSRPSTTHYENESKRTAASHIHHTFDMSENVLNID